MKETLKTMEKTLTHQTQAQIANLQCVDYEELGAAIDMIKDLEEAIYYRTIVEAMGEKSEDQSNQRSQAAPRDTYYYTERYVPMYDDPYYRDMDRTTRGKMYYGDGSNSNSTSMSSTSGSRMTYSEPPIEMHDWREGRSPARRRMYMESKELNSDKSKKLQELESYMQDLTSDMAEMIEGASPEEKQLLQKKLTTLSQKIEQMK